MDDRTHVTPVLTPGARTPEMLSRLFPDIDVHLHLPIAQNLVLTAEESIHILADSLQRKMLTRGVPLPEPNVETFAAALMVQQAMARAIAADGNKFRQRRYSQDREKTLAALSQHEREVSESYAAMAGEILTELADHFIETARTIVDRSLIESERAELTFAIVSDAALSLTRSKQGMAS